MGGKVGDFLGKATNVAGSVGDATIGAAGNAASNVIGDVASAGADFIESDVGKAAILATVAYLAAPAVLGASGAAGAGAGTAGATAAGTGAALSPYAAQAAGAYGGSAAAAQAAAAGSLAGIQAASAAQNALNLGIPTGGGVMPDQVAGMGTNQISSMPPEVAGNADKAALYGTEGYGAAATPTELAAYANSPGLLSTLGSVGSSVLDFAKANPSLTGSLLGALGGGLSAANAPTSQTATTSIDPQIKAEYLANLERAKTTAAGLAPRQYAEPGQMYTQAEQQLYNLGMTPFGATDIQQFYNPYEEQVVQNTLADIERSRQMQAVQDANRATASKAFGGSRYGVQSALTNEAALRTAATTAGQLRQTGYTQAANLGLAARPMNIAGLQTSLGLGSQRDALAQARLDASRNAALERLQITGGALGLQPANVGQTSSQPLYTSGLGSALSGGLTGAYIGSLLQPRTA